MKVKVSRNWFTARSTTGVARFDDATGYWCYTMEPVVRPDGVKIPKKTAIPAGIYEACIRWSEKHGRNVIGLLNVPGFTDVEWHVGNFPSDTEACTLVGQTHSPDFIGESLMAYGVVFAKVQSALLRHEKVTFEYVNEPALSSPMMPPINTEGQPA